MERPAHDHQPPKSGRQGRVASDGQRKVGQGPGDESDEVTRVFFAEFDPGVGRIAVRGGRRGRRQLRVTDPERPVGVLGGHQ